MGGGLNKVYDPGFLLQQALEPFPHGRMEVVVEGGRGGGGEAAAQTESGLSRRFSNYTLETNQPEHCFLISRTKQQCTGWTTLEVTHTPPTPLTLKTSPPPPSPIPPLCFHPPQSSSPAASKGAAAPVDHRCISGHVARER